MCACRARGADRVSSFGDFAAISDKVDLDTARLLSQEVSDGVIAPDYDNEALEILKAKKKGSYVIMRMDPGYEPAEMEARDIYGSTVEQKRNNAVISGYFQQYCDRKQNYARRAVRDLLVSFITLKYTQSNSICFAYDGQVTRGRPAVQDPLHQADAVSDIWFCASIPRSGLRFKEDLSAQIITPSPVPDG